MSKHWQTQPEQGSFFALRLLTWLALTLGRRFIFYILCFVVSHYFVVASHARKSSRVFLNRALQRAPSLWEIYCHMLTFAIVSMDRIYFLSGCKSLFDVHIHGHEIFTSHQGQGCFLLASHMGSFDALRVIAMEQKKHLSSIRILLDIQHNPNALKLIQSLDPELARGVIDARTPAPELALILSEAIADGQLVGIMADRCMQGDRTTPLEFLGKTAEFPQGVWQLASVLKAPVISCFGLYSYPNRYDLHFELISKQLGENRKERADAIAAGMLRYVDLLQHFARSNPFNWFNFYDFWQDETTQHH